MSDEIVATVRALFAKHLPLRSIRLTLKKLYQQDIPEQVLLVMYHEYTHAH
jgi:hypothetical protein